MKPKITDEMREALHQQPTKPVAVEDEQTQDVFFLVKPDSLPFLWEEYIRCEVEKGLAAIDRGEVVDWHPQKIKDEGRRNLAQRTDAN